MGGGVNSIRGASPSVNQNYSILSGNSVLSHPPREPTAPVLGTELEGDEDVSEDDDEREKEGAAPEDVAEDGEGVNEGVGAHVGDFRDNVEVEEVVEDGAERYEKV